MKDVNVVKACRNCKHYSPLLKGKIETSIGRCTLKEIYKQRNEVCKTHFEEDKK